MTLCAYRSSAWLTQRAHVWRLGHCFATLLSRVLWRAFLRAQSQGKSLQGAQSRRQRGYMRAWDQWHHSVRRLAETRRLCTCHARSRLLHSCRRGLHLWCQVTDLRRRQADNIASAAAQRRLRARHWGFWRWVAALHRGVIDGLEDSVARKLHRRHCLRDFVHRLRTHGGERLRYEAVVVESRWRRRSARLTRAVHAWVRAARSSLASGGTVVDDVDADGRGALGWMGDEMSITMNGVLPSTAELRAAVAMVQATYAEADVEAEAEAEAEVEAVAEAVVEAEAEAEAEGESAVKASLVDAALAAADMRAADAEAQAAAALARAHESEVRLAAALVELREVETSADRARVMARRERDALLDQLGVALAQLAQVRRMPEDGMNIVAGRMDVASTPVTGARCMPGRGDTAYHDYGHNEARRTEMVAGLPPSVPIPVLTVGRRRRVQILHAASR